MQSTPAYNTHLFFSRHAATQSAMPRPPSTDNKAAVAKAPLNKSRPTHIGKNSTVMAARTPSGKKIAESFTKLHGSASMTSVDDADNGSSDNCGFTA